eukprot:TRINITY_DN59303_c0_g2_i1.p1 TRINITY_DN59303_c0_g2~~TRINITY_DN59303_c0_g2_i1.p1  ORF type:complete len:277 (+),score=34.04 TRINITY_DN59303_c0_g2_i1:206-1036(+)
MLSSSAAHLPPTNAEASLTASAELEDRSTSSDVRESATADSDTATHRGPGPQTSTGRRRKPELEIVCDLDCPGSLICFSQCGDVVEGTLLSGERVLQLPSEDCARVCDLRGAAASTLSAPPEHLVFFSGHQRLKDDATVCGLKDCAALHIPATVRFSCGDTSSSIDYLTWQTFADVSPCFPGDIETRHSEKMAHFQGQVNDVVDKSSDEICEMVEQSVLKQEPHKLAKLLELIRLAGSGRFFDAEWHNGVYNVSYGYEIEVGFHLISYSFDWFGEH